MRTHIFIPDFLAVTLRRSKRLGVIVALLSLTACGSGVFQGRLESPPEWVYSDLESWISPVEKSRQVKVVYGRGSAQGHKLINKRRALAEAQAVQDATQRFIERFVRITGQTEASSQLKQLSWVQIALPIERFFDSRANTQYVLVQITKASFTRELEFKLRSSASQDPQSQELMVKLLRHTDKIFTDL